MTVLSATKRAELLAKKARLEELLEAALEAYEQALANPNERYRLDTAEGSHSETKRPLKDQQFAIEQIEAQIDRIDRRVNGPGLICNLTVRRKRGNAIRRRW
jgi:hypothetical protein